MASPTNTYIYCVLGPVLGALKNTIKVKLWLLCWKCLDQSWEDKLTMEEQRIPLAGGVCAGQGSGR